MGKERKLTYERNSLELDLVPKSRTVTEQVPMGSKASTPLSVNAIKGYEKQDGGLSYGIVCVISGGERREKTFLQDLIVQKTLHSLRIAFLTKDNQGLQPYQMQEKWEEIQQSRRVDSEGWSFQIDDADKVYLLSDVDEFYEQLESIINAQSACDTGQWIISNPCFEMWLYYCFKNNPTVDLASLEPLPVDKRSQELKRLGNVVVNGGLNPLLAFEKMTDGMEHSMAHYSEDANKIPKLYSTQMHYVAKFLIDTMNRRAGEYNAFIKSKQEWRQQMRKRNDGLVS